MQLLIRVPSALLAGLVLLGFGFYALWHSIGGHAYAAREQLSLLSVHISSAQHITEGGARSATKNRYYLLNASNRTATYQYELRVDDSFPEEFIAGLIKEEIDVLVDENNHSLVYEVRLLDEEGNAHQLLDYETVRDLLQAKAEESAKSPVFWTLGLLLTALGIFGLWKKRQQRQAMD